MKYESITRFFLLKWAHVYDRDKLGASDFDSIKIDNKIRNLQLRAIEENRKISKTSYIFDNMVFANIVEDINFFHLINAVSAEQVRELKKDILLLIDEMEMLAGKSSFGDGNELRFYISNMNFSTGGYTYCQSDNRSVALFRTFILNEIFTRDKTTCERTKQWIDSVIRFSTMISGSGEQQRIMYFKEQREIMNRLDNLIG